MRLTDHIDIPLSRPDITPLERQRVAAVLKTPFLSQGLQLLEFERRLAEYVGRRHAIAVSSGTAGLHVLIRALGIKEADEVITTPFSFIASANCILFERAKPVFVDIDPLTLNIDASRIEIAITAKTKAILAVDIFGYPAEWARLEAIAQKHGLRLIEDSCEALGAEYHGRKAGTFGAAAVFAFYPNKQMTTGEGGIIVTDNQELATLCRSLRNQGRGEGNSWLEHPRLGYNYRLNELSCALGIAQLDRLEDMLSKRAKVAQAYNQKLKLLKGVKLPYQAPGIKRSWFVYVVQLPDYCSRQDRDRLMHGLNDKGIGCQNYFPPIHLQPFYQEMFGYKAGDFPVTEHVSARTLALPFFNKLSLRQIKHVAANLKGLLG